MGKRMLCAALILALWATCPALAREDQAVVKTVPDTQGMEVGAKAAIVVEAKTGRVLFAQNEHERLPIASTTKIMTALMALEQPGLDDMFAVDAAAIRVEGSSMGLREGDQVSLRALAVGMLLASGNDAANAAAVRISGDIPTFVEEMNLRARKLGMVNTSFETPSGLDGEFHYSTAHDMALLTRAALQNPEFVSICSQYRMRASFGDPPTDRWLKNHNKLLNYYEGTIGVKTGFTKKAGRCLVSACRREGIELICITLSCPDDWTTHQNLYDVFFPQLALADVSGQLPPVSLDVVGGTAEQVTARPLEEVALPVPVLGEALRYEVVTPPFVYAPVKQGDYLGEARVYLEAESVYSLPLVAVRDVPLLHPCQEDHSWYDWIVRLFWDE